ncbi:succinate dehydrogenase [Pseudohalocynthiibacter aestuariivivens]|uniref:Succinate dehydrogenase n=1 Tax=Pseudohalocynthiibacter aestuariivivens TaxID=1591409 RepID=A0ABV5JD05_9RHOB|nr:succinate dehydrogenase [Pseudohalocynthiibacter aestuariivivens]MBS9715846.1 succinate dehydrogenase [Pseudohalocynthiibacter aestuariivivens]
MLGVRLYMLQRLTALIMAPLTLGHIAVMIYAVQGGLSTAEILSRTQGSIWWLLFYGSFVVAVSLHAAIGLRVIVHETLGLKRPALNILTLVVSLLLLFMGARAVLAVTLT